MVEEELWKVQAREVVTTRAARPSTLVPANQFGASLGRRERAQLVDLLRCPAICHACTFVSARSWFAAREASISSNRYQTDTTRGQYVSITATSTTTTPTAMSTRHFTSNGSSLDAMKATPYDLPEI